MLITGIYISLPVPSLLFKQFLLTSNRCHRSPYFFSLQVAYYQSVMYRYFLVKLYIIIDPTENAVKNYILKEMFQKQITVQANIIG